MRRVVLLCVLMLAPVLALASPAQQVLPDAQVRGAATFRYLGFALYEARLFTREGAPLNWSADFGLELKYLRNLSEFDLVEGTMRELKRTGPPLPVRDQLAGCFDDVRKGDRFVAVSQGPDTLGFWLNGSRTCTLRHPGIKTRFMEIFLGDNTRSKSFTRKLRGE